MHQPSKLVTFTLDEPAQSVEIHEAVLFHGDERAREQAVLDAFLCEYERIHPFDPLPHTVIARDDPVDFELKDNNGHIIVEVTQVSEDSMTRVIENTYTELHRRDASSTDKSPLLVTGSPNVGTRILADNALSTDEGSQFHNVSLMNSGYGASSMTTIERKYTNKRPIAAITEEAIRQKEQKYRHRYPSLRKILLLDDHTSTYSKHQEEVAFRALLLRMLGSTFDVICFVHLYCVDPNHPHAEIFELRNNRCPELFHEAVKQLASSR